MVGIKPFSPINVSYFLGSLFIKSAENEIVLKNSVNTNILILDEIFDSSLDGQGTDDFFKILKSLNKENVFIITHKGDIMFDKFTNIIKFEKYQNFTRLL